MDTISGFYHQIPDLVECNAVMLLFAKLITNILKVRIIKCVASFISSLLLQNYLQRTQTLQLILIGNYLQK